MRILVMDEGGESLDFSLRCIAEGHKVRWYSPDPRYPDIGKGLIEKVEIPHDSATKWADIILYTGNTKWIELGENGKHKVYQSFALHPKLQNGNLTVNTEMIFSRRRELKQFPQKNLLTTMQLSAMLKRQ